jgi:hypothetical protein
MQKSSFLKCLSAFFYFLFLFFPSRYDPPSVPAPVIEYLVHSLQQFSECATSENENLSMAYVMLLHNIICWYGRLKITQSELYPLITSGIVELLNHKRNSKIQFYALLTLGSIVCLHTHTQTAIFAYDGLDTGNCQRILTHIGCSCLPSFLSSGLCIELCP